MDPDDTNKMTGSGTMPQPPMDETTASVGVSTPTTPLSTPPVSTVPPAPKPPQAGVGIAGVEEPEEPETMAQPEEPQGKEEPQTMASQPREETEEMGGGTGGFSGGGAT